MGAGGARVNAYLEKYINMSSGTNDGRFFPVASRPAAATM